MDRHDVNTCRKHVEAGINSSIPGCVAPTPPSGPNRVHENKAGGNLHSTLSFLSTFGQGHAPRNKEKDQVECRVEHVEVESTTAATLCGNQGIV